MKRGRTAHVGIDVGATSVSSDAHRARNEDVYFAQPERGFFGVFDGMGGHAAAGVAARLAAEEVQEVLAPLAPDAEPEAIADTLRDAFFATDSTVRAEAHAREGDPRGMGTTAVVCVLRPPLVRPGPALARSDSQRAGTATRSGDSWAAYVGWVGDSRAVLLPAGSRSLQTLTVDDGVVRLHAASLAQARKMQDALARAMDYRDLSLRERDFFLERNVLIQAIGTSLRHVHIVEHDLEAGDVLMLLTDGVHDNLTDREIAAVARNAASTQDVAKRLVAAARARSRDPEHFRAKPDDMTAVVVQLQ